MSDSTAAPSAAAAAATDLSTTLSSTTLSSQPDTTPTLSHRGAAGSSSFDLPAGLKRMLSNQYDPDTNPHGIINAGIADNSLCRNELLSYFLSHDRLQLSPADLTYADRFTSSTRLLESISCLFNHYTPDWPEGNASPLPLKKVTPSHIAIASGATGILDELFWNICDQGDGVLLSTPYYNAFDNDLTNRAKAKIIPVDLPYPSPGKSLEHTMFSSSTISAYQTAYDNALASGTPIKALLLCNPHNPTGTIYPRTTVIELARFAAKYKLHFVSDEIYARSRFSTQDHVNPELFHSILSIDTEKECGLDPKYVHVVTSASKDFAVNGFRLGVLVSQHNPALQKAMASVGLLSQSASPAASLWATWLKDEKFLGWYLKENRRRLGRAYNHAAKFFQHYQIPYYPSNSGFFMLIDLSAFAKVAGAADGVPDAEGGEEVDSKGEDRLVEKLLDAGVFVAPGGLYHVNRPGWFRFTFSVQPKTLKLALRRMEKALGVQDAESWEDSRPEFELEVAGEAVQTYAKIQGERRKSWISKLVSG